MLGVSGCVWGLGVWIWRQREGGKGLTIWFDPVFINKTWGGLGLFWAMGNGGLGCWFVWIIIQRGPFGNRIKHKDHNCTLLKIKG